MIKFVGVPERPKPACHELLDRRTRAGLKLYLTFGYPGQCIAEALAYIELLEEELMRLENPGP